MELKLSNDAFNAYLMVASYVGIFYDDFCDALIQKSTEQWLVRMAARIVLDFYLEKKI